MRIAGYIRVSTAEQKLHGFSLTAQRELIERFCQQNGHKLIGIYADEGKSASKALHKRTEILRLLDDAEMGLFDAVAFKDLTRWSRNPSQYYAVQDRLDHAGVSWIAIEQPSLETVTASGKLIVGIQISVAAHESAQTSERIKFINASRIQNKRPICGTPYMPVGYKVESVDGQKTVLIDEDKREMVSAMFDTYEKEQTIQSVVHMTANEYGYRSNPSSVRAMLKNPLYKGTYHGVEDFCEPYLSPERWDTIQRIRSKRHYTAPIKGHDYIFSSLVRCATCGGTMCGRTQYKGTVYYLCRRNVTDKTCPHNKALREDYLEEQMLAAIGDTFSKFQAEITPKQKRKSPAPIKAKLSRLRELYIDGDISKADYTKRAEELEHQLAELSASRPQRVKTVLSDEWREYYANAPKVAKNKAWRAVIDKIEVDQDNNISITYL